MNDAKIDTSKIDVHHSNDGAWAICASAGGRTVRVKNEAAGVVWDLNTDDAQWFGLALLDVCQDIGRAVAEAANPYHGKVGRVTADDDLPSRDLRAWLVKCRQHPHLQYALLNGPTTVWASYMLQALMTWVGQNYESPFAVMICDEADVPDEWKDDR